MEEGGAGEACVESLDQQAGNGWGEMRGGRCRVNGKLKGGWGRGGKHTTLINILPTLLHLPLMHPIENTHILRHGPKAFRQHRQLVPRDLEFPNRLSNDLLIYPAGIYVCCVPGR